MERKELKEIINAVVGKLRDSNPAAACGLYFADEPILTTYYAVGEEDPVETPKVTPKPTPGPTKPPMTTLYAIGEEG